MTRKKLGDLKPGDQFILDADYWSIYNGKLMILVEWSAWLKGSLTAINPERDRIFLWIKTGELLWASVDDNVLVVG